MWERIKVFIGQRLFVAFDGLLAGDWFQLLKENRFAVEPRFWPRAALMTVTSFGNSLSHQLEQLVYGRRIEDVQIEHPPIFILGHWRSGTTHLHNLLSVDDRFSYPTFYHVEFPRGFLVTERFNKPWYSLFMPADRQIDQVAHGFDMPAEDEFAIAQISLLSSYLSWMFPKNMSRYDKYLTLQEATPEEIQRWKAALVEFVRKMTIKTGRPLVFKSPPHTCRIRLLLELFPDARFVHIHRNPFEVFSSTKRMTEVIVRWTQLQSLDPSIVEDRIIRQYREMYDRYLDERNLIAANRLYELGFEDLRRHPLDHLRRLYEQLQLPSFEVVEPKLREYLQSVAEYKPAAYKPLPEPLRNKLVDQWRRTFNEFGYTTEQAVVS